MQPILFLLLIIIITIITWNNKNYKFQLPVAIVTAGDGIKRVIWRGNDFKVESVVNVGDADGAVSDEDEIILGDWTAGAQDVGIEDKGTMVEEVVDCVVDPVVGTGKLTGTFDDPNIGVPGVNGFGAGGMSYFWTCNTYCSAVGTPCQQTSKLFVEARTSCTLPVAEGFSTSKYHKSLQHTW